MNEDGVVWLALAVSILAPEEVIPFGGLEAMLTHWGSCSYPCIIFEVGVLGGGHWDCSWVWSRCWCRREGPKDTGDEAGLDVEPSWEFNSWALPDISRTYEWKKNEELGKLARLPEPLWSSLIVRCTIQVEWHYHICIGEYRVLEPELKWQWTFCNLWYQIRPVFVTECDKVKWQC